jgi:hypothetical protein
MYSSLDGGSQAYRLLVNDTDNLAKSGYNPQNPTKILIHGFGQNGQIGAVVDGKNGRQATNVGHICNPTAYNNSYAYLQGYNACPG